jgi:hypothetical protein
MVGQRGTSYPETVQFALAPPATETTSPGLSIMDVAKFHVSIVEVFTEISIGTPLILAYLGESEEQRVMCTTA